MNLEIQHSLPRTASAFPRVPFPQKTIIPQHQNQHSHKPHRREPKALKPRNQSHPKQPISNPPQPKHPTFRQTHLEQEARAETKRRPKKTTRISHNPQACIEYERSNIQTEKPTTYHLPLEDRHGFSLSFIFVRSKGLALVSPRTQRSFPISNFQSQSHLISRISVSKTFLLPFLPFFPLLFQSPNSNATKCKSTELAGLEEGGCGLRGV